MLYDFEGTSYDTELSETGFRGSLALKLGYIQPHLSVVSYNSKYVLDNEVFENSYSTLGYGVDVELPISKRAYFYLGYTNDTYKHDGYQGAAYFQQLLNHETIYLGLRFNFSGGKSSKK